MKLKISILILILAASAGSNAFSQTINAALTGTWSGKVAEAGRSDYYSVTITVNEVSVGELAGTVSYPDYNCGGILKLRFIDYYAAGLDEQLTYGVSDCVDGGHIIIGFDGSKLSFEWRKAGLDYTAKGYLDKQ